MDEGFRFRILGLEFRFRGWGCLGLRVKAAYHAIKSSL